MLQNVNVRFQKEKGLRVTCWLCNMISVSLRISQINCFTPDILVASFVTSSVVMTTRRQSITSRRAILGVEENHYEYQMHLQYAQRKSPKQRTD